MITFRYQELSDAGIPRFPSYVGLRSDASSAPSKPPASGPPTDSARSPEKITVKKSAKPAATPSADSATASTAKRYFECVEGTSSKFWEVSVTGAELTTRWGGIGAAGQSKTKAFASPEAAAKERDSLIDSKLAGGYREIAQS